MKPKDDDKLRAIAEATFTLVEQTGLSGLTMAAIAREAGVDYPLARLNDVADRVPHLCKVAPSGPWHMDDVHRAGVLHVGAVVLPALIAITELKPGMSKPIPGLYCAGEMVGGLFYFNYPSGTGLVSGAVFGKIAGTGAGQAAKA